MKRLKELFEELRWIPEYLSKRVNNLAKISYEEKDLRQELDLKLWQSLNDYFHLIKEGKKPRVNIRRYCHTACLNRKVDFIRFTLNQKANKEKVCLNEGGIDIGKQDFSITLEVGDYDEDLKIMVDGMDILETECDDIKKMMFKDFIIGFSYEEIAFNYNVKINIVRSNIFKTRKKVKENYFKNNENLFDLETLLYIEKGNNEEDNENSSNPFQPGQKARLINERLKFSKGVTSPVMQRHRKYLNKIERRK